MEPTRVEGVQIFGLKDALDPDGWPSYVPPKYKRYYEECNVKPPDLDQRITRLRKYYERELEGEESG